MEIIIEPMTFPYPYLWLQAAPVVFFSKILSTGARGGGYIVDESWLVLFPIPKRSNIIFKQKKNRS